MIRQQQISPNRTKQREEKETLRRAQNADKEIETCTYQFPKKDKMKVTSNRNINAKNLENNRKMNLKNYDKRKDKL